MFKLLGVSPLLEMLAKPTVYVRRQLFKDRTKCIVMQFGSFRAQNSRPPDVSFVMSRLDTKGKQKKPNETKNATRSAFSPPLSLVEQNSDIKKVENSSCNVFWREGYILF